MLQNISSLQASGAVPLNVLLGSRALYNREVVGDITFDLTGCESISMHRYGGDLVQLTKENTKPGVYYTGRQGMTGGLDCLLVTRDGMCGIQCKFSTSYRHKERLLYFRDVDETCRACDNSGLRSYQKIVVNLMHFTVTAHTGGIVHGAWNAAHWVWAGFSVDGCSFGLTPQ